jgi:cytochrome P450
MAVEAEPQPTVAPDPPTRRERVPGVSNLVAFMRDRRAFVEDLHTRYGDVAGFSLAGDRWVQLTHPADIERVLVATGRTNRKGYQTYKQTGYVFRTVFGNGLLTSEGGFWRHQRRLAQPAFHTRRVHGYADMMVRYAGELADGWRPGQELDMRPAMSGLTQRIAAAALFGADTADAAARIPRVLDALLAGFDAELGSLVVERLPAWVPTPNRRRVDAAIGELDRLVAQVVADRRGAPAGTHDDLLAMLSEARDDDGATMSDRQLRDELVTLYLAGQETTASALTWLWYALGRHPDLAARVRTEVTGVLGDRPATAADAGRLPLLRAAIDEVLRLYPPLWGVYRLTEQDMTVRGHRIPAGTYLWLSSWITHRDPRWFDHPADFDPDRWLDGRTAGLPRYAYWPFGGGPRLCIGNGFALTAATLVAATLLRRYRHTLLDGEVTPTPSITLRPMPGVRVRLDGTGAA